MRASIHEVIRAFEPDVRDARLENKNFDLGTASDVEAYLPDWCRHWHRIGTWGRVVQN
jgi:hypothetical protein